MIIPLPSILAVSANAYTVLQETQSSIGLYGTSRSLQAAGGFSLYSCRLSSITSVPTATDTLPVTIPAFSTTFNEPIVTEVPSPHSIAVPVTNESLASGISLAALFPVASCPSPCISRRQFNEAPSETFSTETTGPTRTITVTTSVTVPSSPSSPTSPTSSETSVLSTPSPDPSGPDTQTSFSLTSISVPTLSSSDAGADSTQESGTFSTSSDSLSLPIGLPSGFPTSWSGSFPAGTLTSITSTLIPIPTLTPPSNTSTSSTISTNSTSSSTT
ncbi:uncharacterized protein FOMMEDRAFT_144980, partial [Fomitiporia mediterranea MF3/22]|uniref:uncharacterized protein n=1 Tax=Fomitiporia mediterranea (strain MF3/22) TaxID=694068 RepID=UPI000440766F